MVKIKKRLTLKGQLRDMSIGATAEISARKTGYKPHIVREAVCHLKREGLLFECTERGVTDGIRVTRLQ